MTSLLSETVGRAAHQDVPARRLRRRPRQPAASSRCSTCSMKAVRNRAPARPDARGARRRRGRRRHRVCVLAHRQRHFDGRRLHGLHHRAADGRAADPRARQSVRARAGGARRRRKHLRHPRREAAHRRQARRAPRLSSARARLRFEDVGFAYEASTEAPAVRDVTLDGAGRARRSRSSAARAPANRRSSISCRGCST